VGVTLIKVVCNYCGEIFDTYKCYIDRGGGKYCSIECNSLDRTLAVQKECEFCGKIFKAKNFQIKQGQGRYCSSKCMGLNNIKDKCNKVCRFCGNSFEIRYSALKYRKGDYCSVKCARFYRKGKFRMENNPNWRGGMKESWQRWYKKKKKDLNYQLNHRIKESIRHHLRRGVKNGRRTEELLGYTFEDLKEHLEKTFPKASTWDDYISGKLQIDHIQPISSFSFTKVEDEEFKKCWSLENLQLLYKTDNRRKSNKLNWRKE